MFISKKEVEAIIKTVKSKIGATRIPGIVVYAIKNNIYHI